MAEQTAIPVLPSMNEEAAMTTSGGPNDSNATTSNDSVHSVHSSDPGKPTEAGLGSENHPGSPWLRYILLTFFVFAQFLDTYYNGALFSAIPTMAVALDLTNGQAIWLISAYQMLMASFLLISGRLSDLYSPKIIFLSGVIGLIVLSIVSGFVQEKIGLIVLRALLGICAALTVPSSLAMIIYFFPEPKAQAAAIGITGIGGAFGGIFGAVLGAVLTQFGSWRWVFYFVAIMAAPIAVGSFFLIPNGLTTGDAPKHLRGVEKIKKIDLFGIFLLTVGLLLLAFAIIQATTIGWVQAGVLVPLFLGAALVFAFFYWETKIPEDAAAVPPRIWQFPNFILLCCLVMIPYGWVNSMAALLSPYWQEQFGYTNIGYAVRALPLIATFIPFTIIITGPLRLYMTKKWFVVGCLVIMAGGDVVLRFADSPDRYWSYVFHTFIWSCFGFAGVYLFVNIEVFRCSPATMAGTVGAIFNSGLQLGSALGTSIVTSISQSVQSKQVGTDYQSLYAGTAAAFTFYASLCGFAALATLVFLKPENVITETDAAGDILMAQVGVSGLDAEGTSNGNLKDVNGVTAALVNEKNSILLDHSSNIPH